MRERLLVGLESRTPAPGALAHGHQTRLRLQPLTFSASTAV